ncbi:preprotein translocase subunit SecG [Chelativorans sp. ZYF759]|uniref:preprotein translocase subunit SecG n=1 Tax=Chelativorans sp. ZYF759 TaxID=2692213 RepID=UPI00145EBDE4|nr:preprotein translocase subunit SecG [Chelativorans sp. ZYF759]NMG38506.1 preprotein translocase subunit SecG [Chelativorans sp. ZYF759]
MQTILIVIHLMIVIALVTVVLMQRSEGGGLGIGGGSNFAAARGSGNLLTKVTAGLAVAFFATSLSLSLMARYGAQPVDIFDRMPGQEQTLPEGGGGVLDQLGGDDTPAPPSGTEPTGQPQVPSGQ